MPKGEIKPMEDEEEVIEQIGPSPTLEEDDDKPPYTQDNQGKASPSQVLEQEPPSRITTQDLATSQ